MDNDLNKKRKYFKDSIYLKYENQKNLNQEDKKCEKKIYHKKSKIFDKLKKVAVMVIIGTAGVTAYAGVTGNLNLQEMGFLKVSQNYFIFCYYICTVSCHIFYCNITIFIFYCFVYLY